MRNKRTENQLGPIDRKWWNLKKKSYWYIYVLLFVIMTFKEEDVDLFVTESSKEQALNGYIK